MGFWEKPDPPNRCDCAVGRCLHERGRACTADIAFPRGIEHDRNVLRDRRVQTQRHSLHGLQEIVVKERLEAMKQKMGKS